jgi:hypothetical protein
LALLFPECSTDAQIKDAAEAALKAHKKRETKTSRKFSLQQKNLSRLLFSSQRKQACLLPDVQLRQSKRVSLLENLVDRALSQLYDKDSEELTEDDVGRTIFRRASPEDLPRIRKLLLPKSSVADDELTTRWWSTASFVLVLCRAIAALEDPPLGCAVLTPGFDLEHGKLLRVVEIGNEPHLPKERLIECLQSFAICMDSTLTLKGQDSGTKHNSAGSTGAVRSGVPNAGRRGREGAREWPLQSVQEEEESEASSSSDQRRALKDQSSKPSKRTRRL